MKTTKEWQEWCMVHYDDIEPSESLIQAIQDDATATLRTRLQQVEIERDEAKVARDFAELACQRKDERLKEADESIKARNWCLHMLVGIIERNIKAPGEFGWVIDARKLIGPNPTPPRRDTFLNPKPQDVM